MRLLALSLFLFKFVATASCLASSPALPPAKKLAQSLPPANPVVTPAAPATPATPTVRLLIGAPEAATDEWQSAWLALRPGRVETVTLVVPRGAVIAWADANGGCSATDTTAGVQKIARQAIDVPDGMMPFCVRPSAKMTFRVLGHVTYVPIGGTRLTEAVESEPIEVRGGFELGPVGMTLLSTFLGFLAAFGTSSFLRWQDQSADKAKAKRAIETRVVEALEPEFSRNIRAIKAYLEDKNAAPPTIKTGAFDYLQSEGPLAFLQEPERAAYFARLQRVFQAGADFSRSAGHGETRDVLEKKAQAILDRAEELPKNT